MARLVTKCLGEICDEGNGIIRTGPFGSQLHQSDYDDEGTPVVMPRNIVDGKVDTNDIARISKKHVSRLFQHCLEVGDIVYGRRGDIGRHAFIRKYERGWLCGTGCLRISLGNSVLDSKFLHYYLDQKDVITWIKNQAIGATMPNLNTSILRSVPITFPPLPTQRKIAAILTAYDDLIENNLRRIKILEEMAQNLYREWFVKFRFPGHQNARFVDSPLGRIPEGWEVKRLDQIALLQNNGTKAGEHLSDRIYLPIDCIPRKSLAINEINSWEEAQSSLHLFDEGDILFGAMRPYFHKVVVAPFKGVTRKTCFVFKSPSPDYHAFTALTLFQESTVSFANAHSKGATIPYAVWPQALDGMPVVAPTFDQVKKFENVVGPMIARIGTMFFQNTTLRHTRDLLLPRLISGEVDVSDMDIAVPEEAEA